MKKISEVLNFLGKRKKIQRSNFDFFDQRFEDLKIFHKYFIAQVDRGKKSQKISLRKKMRKRKIRKFVAKKKFLRSKKGKIGRENWKGQFLTGQFNGNSARKMERVVFCGFLMGQFNGNLTKTTHR